MWKPWSHVEGPARILVVFVAMLLVATGLCGVQWLLFATAGRGMGPFLTVVFVLGYLELAVIAISVVGILVMLVVLGVRKLIGYLGTKTKPPEDEVQNRFPRDRDRS